MGSGVRRVTIPVVVYRMWVYEVNGLQGALRKGA